MWRVRCTSACGGRGGRAAAHATCRDACPARHTRPHAPGWVRGGAPPRPAGCWRCAPSAPPGRPLYRPGSAAPALQVPGGQRRARGGSGQCGIQARAQHGSMVGQARRCVWGALHPPHRVPPQCSPASGRRATSRHVPPAASTSPRILSVLLSACARGRADAAGWGRLGDGGKVGGAGRMQPSRAACPSPTHQLSLSRRPTNPPWVRRSIRCGARGAGGGAPAAPRQSRRPSG